MVTTKIGFPLTFQPLSAFLIFMTAITATIIVATNTLTLIGKDTYNYTLSKG
jgi:hypothetical protein